ncbi:DUF6274 family protein [Streptomyces pratensis]|uniref:DUF6274 family protein n=1 Tax=Streptomyces pratensis TaxID=1169025 RepID=UPI00301AAE99
MSAPSARHETRALLRAHLAAASAYGHLTRHCPVCHRLLRLAQGPAGPAESDTPQKSAQGSASGEAAERRPGTAPRPEVRRTPAKPRRRPERAVAPPNPDERSDRAGVERPSPT